IIQEEIQQTIQQIVHLEKVASQLRTTEQELETAYDEQDGLLKKLDKELRDVERLEGLTTTSMFYKILGSKEKQLDKERQEYLELSLKTEDIAKTIQLLEYEVNLLEAKSKSKFQIAKVLEGIKIKREEEIIKTDPVLRHQLLGISEQLESNYKLQKEISEAEQIGAICDQLINRIIGLLQKVRNWGQWPGNTSRSRMQRYARRDAIDRARNLSYQIKHHLHLFNQELADLNSNLSVHFDPKAFTNFSTSFFSNLITDWIQNQQLSQAIGSASNTRNQVHHVLKQLDVESTQCDNNISKLLQDRDHIVSS
ncbi:MAG: hypothetical protein AAFR14_06595, partial [Bacteroidota bacterium]